MTAAWRNTRPKEAAGLEEHPFQNGFGDKKRDCQNSLFFVDFNESGRLCLSDLFLFQADPLAHIRYF